MGCGFKPTPPMRVEPPIEGVPFRITGVSIHTTLAGGDQSVMASACPALFQSAPPLRDGDFGQLRFKIEAVFQSAPSTKDSGLLLRYTQFFDLRGVVPSDDLQSGDFGLDFFHVLRHLV